MKKGEKDIIRSEWVVESVLRGEVLPLSRRCVGNHAFSNLALTSFGRYLYFAAESRKRDPGFYESPPSPDDGQTDEDTEKGSEAGEEPPVDAETRSWIIPSGDEPDLVAEELKVNEPGSDTESEDFEPEEDSYDFVFSGSDGAVSPRAELKGDIQNRQPVSSPIALRTNVCP